MSAASGDVPTPSHPPNSPARVSPLRPPVIAQSPPMRRRPETMRGVPPASKPSRKRRRQPQQEEDPLYIDDNENIENNNADDVVNGDHAPEANGETQPPVLNGARQSRRKKTRRRVAERSEWDRNKNRAARLKGQPYIDYKDREVDAKHPLPRTCKANSQKHQKCFHCNEFSEDERATICREYYELGDWIRQKDYLLHREEKCEIKQRKVTDPNNQRQASYKHSFCKPDGSVIPVCQSFFLKTLGMKNDHALRAARAQRGAQGNFQGRDRRGRHPPANKTPEVDVEHARDHIRSFPVMESHYCRKSSTKKYLPAGLNQSKMYHLYKIWAKAAGFKVLGRQTYIKIFKNDFNYGFYRPKKDQCLICNKKKDMEQSNSPGLEKFIADVYQPHKDRETESLAEKQADKERSAAEQGYQSVTFDLESVLYTPCSDVSVMYYKRKLCVYNLTIYEQFSAQDVITEVDEFVPDLLDDGAASGRNHTLNKRQVQPGCETCCLPGPEGPPGPPGQNGKNGMPGKPGLPGRPGKPPPTCVIPVVPPCRPCRQGGPGKQGPQGTAGDPGDPGNPGKLGVDGRPGDAGPQGLVGPPGTPGSDGPPGKDGVPAHSTDTTPGDPGVPGLPGPNGVPGSNGLPGTDGQPGGRGPRGPPGKNGRPGKDGLPGPRGVDGIPGDSGEEGICPKYCALDGGIFFEDGTQRKARKA